MASLAWRALPAWICPPAHLYSQTARMRASLTTGLMAWAFLTGLGLVFAQLTQFQGFRAHGHALIPAAYGVFDVALALSPVTAGLGGLPLWLLMLRCALVILAAAVTAVSAARGTRAALAEQG